MIPNLVCRVFPLHKVQEVKKTNKMQTIRIVFGAVLVMFCCILRAHYCRFHNIILS